MRKEIDPMTKDPVLGVAHSEIISNIPQGACDCHVHVFGNDAEFPMWKGRSYTPPPAPVEALAVHQRALRFDRVVIVQPSIYGTDNRCTLDAVAKIGRGARAIAVVDNETTRRDLKDLAHGGVVGIRLNLAAAAAADLDRIRKQLYQAVEIAEPLGWHVQIFTELKIVAALENDFRQAPTPSVIDHFGRANAGEGTKQPGFDVLLDLVAAGHVYVKLSAPYLVSSSPTQDDVVPLMRALVRANSSRLLWGSNWPHPGAGTGIPADGIVPLRPIDDGAAVDTFASELNDPAVFKRILVDNPAKLFGFSDKDGLIP
ncbi:amidohydrolase family protein [Agrobacterium salinitolerans]|uniref:amidohydrolase family protein n=1 Tax=Agrobacterium salinitolerans TaxID=1183413 RepID=UPI0022B82EE8|nr:amidohydrolase family protein [Agrobacterium salinitolerans]MCZ7977251.1 amidohydrolase family protein [Agrobacterium salinitolerans]